MQKNVLNCGYSIPLRQYNNLLFIVRRKQQYGEKLSYVTINTTYKIWYHTRYV